MRDVDESAHLFKKYGSFARDVSPGASKAEYQHFLKDVVKNKWLVARCAGIGSLIGTIPGLRQVSQIKLFLVKSFWV